jgi:spermidine synthase
VRGALLGLAGLALALGARAWRENALPARGTAPWLLASAAGALLAFAAFTRSRSPLVTSSVNYTLLGRPELLSYDEDRTASVSVVRLGPHERALFINGLVSMELRSPVAWTEAADIALPSHPAARRVFVAGLGAGLSAGVSALYPRAQVQVVEISPAVVRALPFFDELTYGASQNTRVGLVAGDARHYLAATRERFDVILPDVYLSALTGTAYLYNVEFFRLCAARLAPGGRAALGSPLHDPLDLVIAAGFVEAFRDVRALRSPHDGLWILIGSNEPIALPGGPLLGEGVWLLEQRLARLGLAGRSLTSLASLGRHQLLDHLRGARPSTDDRPVVDYLGSLDPALALSW